MRKSDTKQQPTVTIRIEQGEVTPAMREQWRRLWQKLISGVKND